MRCGHCKGEHETVVEVRKCSQTGRRPGKPLEGPLRPRDRSPREVRDLHRKFSGLSPAQQDYLSDLLGHFGLELSNETVSSISWQDGQPIIDRLVDARRLQATGKPYELPSGVRHLAHPGRGKPRERTPSYPPLPDVPEGHYAIPSRTGNNDFEFFRVDRPPTGKIWVKTVIGGHPEYNVRGMKNVRAVLQAIIDFGIDKAGILYGHELGQCRHCNRELTKYASRQLSAGRHCADKNGYVDDWDIIQANRPEGVD